MKLCILYINNKYHLILIKVYRVNAHDSLKLWSITFNVVQHFAQLLLSTVQILQVRINGLEFDEGCGCKIGLKILCLTPKVNPFFRGVSAEFCPLLRSRDLLLDRAAADCCWDRADC
jgi:hypothetical protein